MCALKVSLLERCPAVYEGLKWVPHIFKFDGIHQEGGSGRYSRSLEHSGGQSCLPPRPGHIAPLPTLQQPPPQVQGAPCKHF